MGNSYLLSAAWNTDLSSAPTDRDYLRLSRLYRDASDFSIRSSKAVPLFHGIRKDIAWTEAPPLPVKWVGDWRGDTIT